MSTHSQLYFSPAPYDRRLVVSRLQPIQKGTSSTQRTMATTKTTVLRNMRIRKQYLPESPKKHHRLSQPVLPQQTSPTSTQPELLDDSNTSGETVVWPSTYNQKIVELSPHEQLAVLYKHRFERFSTRRAPVPKIDEVNVVKALDWMGSFSRRTKYNGVVLSSLCKQLLATDVKETV